jgi:4'-phosphopantetheinyl transferase
MPADLPAIRWFSAGMQHVASDQNWLEPSLAQRLAAMPYTKRREEARLGRWTAKATIARAMGLEPSVDTLRQIEVRNAADGAPEATVRGQPLAAVIAMTDRADWAVCAMMDGIHRIGCDLELVEPRSAAFVRDYFNPCERDCVAASSEPDATANLIWSAKESALKVMRTGLRRDTRSVTVNLSEVIDNGWNRLTVTAEEGLQFPGWWIRYGSFLLTMAGEVETAPPRNLEEPQPLCTAEPSHSWMDSPYIYLT